MLFRDLFRKKNRKLLFTTPSHSQKFFLFSKFRQFYKFDISETDAHCPEEVLTESQAMAAKVYGTKQTLYLTNGSSSGIITAVLALVRAGEKVLFGEGAHRCHKNAVELAGAVPVFYELEQNKDWDVPERLEPEKLEQYLKNDDIKAVIVTSPSYEGIVSDIKSIKNVCEKYGARLVVDEAHGALYPFSDELPESAIRYADVVVQSLHKTAGGLNPTALVHNNTDIDLQPALDKISTTSPSYALLATIEKNIAFLNSNRGRKAISNLVQSIKELRNRCQNIEFYGDDITKILIKKDGLSGEELSDVLFNDYNIEDEKTNTKSTMLLCGIGTTAAKVKKLADVLSKL